MSHNQSRINNHSLSGIEAKIMMSMKLQKSLATSVGDGKLGWIPMKSIRSLCTWDEGGQAKGALL